MMTKKVLLEIKSRYIIAGEEEVMEFEIPGAYELQNGVHKVEYEERLTETKGRIKNTLIFSDEKAEIIRKGFINSRMIFSEADKNTSSYYTTPYGALEMEIQTYKVNIDENEDYILVKAHYLISIDKKPSSECRLMFKIKW